MSSFVVGGVSTRHMTKARQLALAKKIGFNVPPTILTDSYEEVCSFVDSHGIVAVKPFSPHYWRHTTTDTLRFASTSIIDSSRELDRDTVEAAPSIYQQFITKSYELRVTVIGRTIHAAKITKRDGGYFVDARMFIESPQTSVEIAHLDAALESAILAFMEQAGLIYGCLDLVVDRFGVIHFLEVNPSGQFLYIEQLVPELRTLASFASLLANGHEKSSRDYSEDISTKAFEASSDFQLMNEALAKGHASFSAHNPFYTELA
ncbi:hypothetical protein P3W33_17525 [Luteibacter sp. PPL552]